MTSTGLIALLWLASPPEPLHCDPVRGVEGPALQGGSERAFGELATVYVHFDGLTLGECNPSNSHGDCDWINPGRTFDPWSGTWQTRVAILQAMRAVSRELGIRVTGDRPTTDENYVMVVYGGTDAEDSGTLGVAPSGDCGDANPNQIAYAYLDGEYADWVNGGATTALHEAAHTWGLDHIAAGNTVMAPSGNNSRVYFNAECSEIVTNTDLDPGGVSCPEINDGYCSSVEQDDAALLVELLGPPYVDDRPPEMALVFPEDGQYLQGPLDFDVDIEVHDDLHPQIYERSVAIEGLVEHGEFVSTYDPSFPVVNLPLGEWSFEVLLRDEAGNESMLSFSVTIGEDPPPDDPESEGCACAAGPPSAVWPLALCWSARRRRRHMADSRRPCAPPHCS